MPDGSIPLLVAILVLLVLSALLSAIEMAYSSVNKIKLKNLANNGKRKANSVLKMLDKYDKLISVVLVGNNILNIAAASIATVFFAKVLEGQAVDSTTISTIVLTVAVLLFCEITPKYIAKVYPERACMVLFPLTILFYYLI